MSGAARIARPAILPATVAALDVLPYRRLILNERREIWCLVDADDYPWIVERNWNVGWHRNTRWKFYAKRNTGPERSTVYLHREILLRADPRPAEELAGYHGDHKNGQSLDCRRANLRWLTADENRRHITKRENIPSLDQIVARLLRTHAPPADIPF